MPDAGSPPRHVTAPAGGAAAPAHAGHSESLLRMGLQPGQQVRFRRRDGRGWVEGTAAGVERDGSLGIRDSDGRSRAIRVGRIEARVPGPRGALRWEPLPDLASRVEQLALF